MRDLRELSPFLDLRSILRKLSEEYFSDDDRELLVFNLDFFRRLSRLLEDSSREEVNNYLVFVVASSAEVLLPRRFRDGLNNFRLVRCVNAWDSIY